MMMLGMGMIPESLQMPTEVDVVLTRLPFASFFRMFGSNSQAVDQDAYSQLRAYGAGFRPMQ
jgi:hypothetical protein